MAPPAGASACARKVGDQRRRRRMGRDVGRHRSRRRQHLRRQLREQRRGGGKILALHRRLRAATSPLRAYRPRFPPAGAARAATRASRRPPPASPRSAGRPRRQHGGHDLGKAAVDDVGTRQAAPPPAAASGAATCDLGQRRDRLVSSAAKGRPVAKAVSRPETISGSCGSGAAVPVPAGRRGGLDCRFQRRNLALERRNRAIDGADLAVDRIDVSLQRRQPRFEIADICRDARHPPMTRRRRSHRPGAQRPQPRSIPVGRSTAGIAPRISATAAASSSTRRATLAEARSSLQPACRPCPASSSGTRCSISASRSACERAPGRIGSHRTRQRHDSRKDIGQRGAEQRPDHRSGQHRRPRRSRASLPARRSAAAALGACGGCEIQGRPAHWPPRAEPSSAAASRPTGPARRLVHLGRWCRAASGRSWAA